MRPLLLAVALTLTPLAPAASAAAIDDAVTASPQGTRAGVILGTPGFMSPEQARGQEVDKRTDIWAFGCVLFAMLTGRTPFAGDTLSDAIAATLSSEPDWSALPPDTPESIHRLLQRCLQRDLRRRLRDIGDACADLDEPMQPRRRTGVASVGSPAPRSVSFQRLTDSLGMNESPAISPDGRMVAFVAPVEGRRHIWVRLLAGGAPLRVTHDEGDHEHPRWSTRSLEPHELKAPALRTARRFAHRHVARASDQRGTNPAFTQNA